MTVILMLAMFATFFAIDYLRKGKEAIKVIEAGEEASWLLLVFGRNISPDSI